MSMSFRIQGCGRLSRAQQIEFTFDGKAFQGLRGDTLASALLANGVHLTGRSFKYHRARGIMAAGSEEPNALVTISRDDVRVAPNVRAPVQELYDGMVSKSQNRWPNLNFDIGVINDALSPLFSAGFYYKTFMWPKAAWDKFYEPIIRNAAGLGESPTQKDSDFYSARHAHCDVLVIGAGAGGLSAALSAANAGAKVIICDEQGQMGGALRFESGARIEGRDGWEWAQETVASLKAMDNVTVLPRTTGFGYYAQNFVALAQVLTDHLDEPEPNKARERLWKVRAKRVILATGAIERPMVFGDNDRPGILLAGAARTFLNHYGVSVGQNIAIYCACDSAYYAAFDLQRAGIKIAGVIDSRAIINEDLLDEARKLDIKVLPAHAILSVSGRKKISAISVAPITGGAKRHLNIDALITSAGWTPSVHLYSQSRGKVIWEEEGQRFLPGSDVQHCASVGACNGALSLQATIEEALYVGEDMARQVGKTLDTRLYIRDVSGESMAGNLLGPAPGTCQKGKAFIDYQNDVTVKDIRQAVREGMHSIEHVKRYTTTGMATDQGKTSNLHALAIAAHQLGREIPQVGLTTFRHPFTPVTFGTIVGHGRNDMFDVTRKTPMHSWHEDNGAVFEDVGNWKRPWYYPKSGETMHEAVNRESKTVRDIAGMFDASTLGKIEVMGPDAAKFMHLMYTNPFMKLGVERLRYGIMCREDGFIYDDGVVGRVSENCFHVTTTTGGAPRVLQHMEDYLQTEFPDLKVWLTSTSEQWAVIAVQGPKAREIIAPLVEGIDLSNEAMAHMSMRKGTICGVPTRLFRMSFTGELGYEINVPADYGAAVWDAIWQQGKPLGMCTYGTETMHVLRAEKGYIIVGQDTDGTVTPDDGGLSWAVGKKKQDFVGIRGMKRPDLVGPNRPQLVGLKTKDPNVVLEEGAQIVDDPNQTIPWKMTGHVTSSYWSPNLNHSIALGLVTNGFERMGETIYLPMVDGIIEAQICDPVFIDPKGERLHG